jgi:hypothetical protein
MDNKYLKQSYSSIGIKLGGSKKSNKTRKKRRKISKNVKRKYKIIKFSSLLK